MKVLHCYRTYFPDPPGGLQEAIRQMCLGTQRYGVTNKVFCLARNPIPRKIERPECQVIRSRSWASPASCDLGAFDAFTEFSRLARETDIIHYQFPWPFGDLLHLAVGHDAPSILTYHSDIIRQRWLGRLYSPLMWRMLNNMRYIIATSPAYAKTSQVLTNPRIREKVRVIPLGIDEKSYPEKGDEHVFSRIGINSGEPYFLFIGVLRYYKGVHYLIKAARNVGAKLIIAGVGPEENKLKKLAQDIEASNIIFAGIITDQEKVSLLKNCHALVLPSHLRSEAFGMVLVEASMFSKPLISCEIGTGTSYVNKHEITGVVVPPESPYDLENAMKTLLSDVSLANTMGKNARMRYQKLFSGEALGKAYYELINTL